ncbi:dimethylaniline monooxygenase (N-oxide forming) [Rhizodiscina lignyota]|uniref:Dimethylaniline monooxygenase (N-oxide forming) n=1 Tax=Rhizodiscina lignyota TaxID=1504668 RepID=A0A9P4M4R0_9PEZI|nr:dimethylaniline monooxygenase (N-oxide forming) [Rhizodiscina lignyota]
MATLTAPRTAGAPSSQRIEQGSVNIPVGKFPSPPKSQSVDADKIADDFAKAFNNAIRANDHKAIVRLFDEKNSYWRDHLCLSWDLRTLKGTESISKFLQNGCRVKSIEIDRSTPFRSPHIGPLGLQFFIMCTTDVGEGSGIVRLCEEDIGVWKVFTMYTVLQSLNGAQEALGQNRATGVNHGEDKKRKNWRDQRAEDVDFQGKDPAVLIVGAGQGGLTVAARLKMLNVDTLVVDREERVGDNWRNRYHQLVLHDPVWFDHMPYLPFPANWPVFTPKDKLADFFETYVQLLELNVWTSTELVSSSWDDATKQWTVVLERRKADGTGETRTFHPRHVIQATGQAGKKYLPSIDGMADFKGERLCHSSEFTGAKPNAEGKKAVVIGSCNSGHDIAQDYYENGYNVTMIQRSTTSICSAKTVKDVALKALYSEDAPATEDSDIFVFGLPSEIFKAQQRMVTQLAEQNDAETIAGLEKVGFKMDSGPDGAGLLFKYFQRGGGYYIDVGASQLVIDGKIKIKQGQEVTKILPHGLQFTDGSKLDADEIVVATGYGNMRSQTREIFGDAVADRVGPVWGFNQEGEFRALWRPSGHPGFWLMGGNLCLSRYFSRVLALQIKARELGLY